MIFWILFVLEFEKRYVVSHMFVKEIFSNINVFFKII